MKKASFFVSSLLGVVTLCIGTSEVKLRNCETGNPNGQQIPKVPKKLEMALHRDNGGMKLPGDGHKKYDLCKLADSGGQTIDIGKKKDHHLS